MTPFEQSFTATEAEIDELGHVNNAAWVRWIQEIATAHWRAAAPRAHVDAYVWVVTRHEIDYLRALGPGETVTGRTWVGEAMTYRTLGMIEEGLSAIQNSKDMDGRLKAIEEYAAECSIIKVALSEYCDYITDEMVQIFGGYGYSADYPAERAYRDVRINRIFEGTNEINRMLIPGRLMKAAMSGRLALLPAAQALMDEILTPSMASFDTDETLLASEQKLAQNAKKVALMTLGTAAQKYMMGLADQQEILMGVADIITDAFAMESAILRTQKLAASQGDKTAERFIDMTRVFCNDAVERIEAHAKNPPSVISI